MDPNDPRLPRLNMALEEMRRNRASANARFHAGGETPTLYAELPPPMSGVNAFGRIPPYGQTSATMHQNQHVLAHQARAPNAATQWIANIMGAAWPTQAARMIQDVARQNQPVVDITQVEPSVIDLT